MKPTDPHIKELFQKYLAGTVTEQELDELVVYFDLKEHSGQLRALILDQFEKEIPSTVPQERIDSIAERTDKIILLQVYPKVKLFYTYKKLAAVAAVFIMILGGLFVYMSRDKRHADNITGHVQEILPGTNSATLIIEEGKPIQLSEAQTTLQNTGDTIGYGDGEAIMVSNIAQWATLTTPRAGQYRIILEDGTKVWLNAASQIRYPTKFVGKERRIHVSGEVYLEVAHLTDDKPFIVETGTQTIRVLGTKFNVEAYPDMDVQLTTLVEGSVQVSGSTENDVHILQAGQQARIARSGTASILHVDTEDYIAWIDGFIALNSVDLRHVVRQLERWYDVDFDDIPETLGKKKVFGSLKRDLPLKAVLQALESNYNVMFTVNERRVNVRER